MGTSRGHLPWMRLPCHSISSVSPWHHRRQAVTATNLIPVSPVPDHALGQTQFLKQRGLLVTPLLSHISETSQTEYSTFRPSNWRFPSVGKMITATQVVVTDVSNFTGCFILQKLFQKKTNSLTADHKACYGRYSLAAPHKHAVTSACQFIPMLPHISP